MTRRIIYILLAVVVVLVVVLGIRWWLNRDTGGETVVEEVPGEVEDMNATAPDAETAPEGDTGEAAPAEEGAVTEGAVTEGSTADTAVTEETAPPAGEGEAAGEDAAAETGGAPTGETATDTAAGEDAATDTGSTEAAAPEGSTEGAEETSTADASLGGVPDSGDAEVGGGMVEPGPADASGGATTGEAAGTGGQVAVLPIAQIVVPGQPVQHIVQNWEWLTQLARCYGTTVHDIQAANNYACPDLIHPGWVVNIPNPGNAGPITINEMPCFIYYTVQQGDTLYSIAQEFGIHFQWLARINAVYNYDYIQIGQMLVIPNPIPPEMTTPPAQPFYYSPCWGYGCGGWGYDGYWYPYGW